MKIKLSTSIHVSEWKSSFFEEGIKRGDFTSQEYEKKKGRILIQSARHPFHHRIGLFLVIEFWKNKTSIFVDKGWWDDSPNPTMFGHYVNGIMPHEIVMIYPVRGTLEGKGVNEYLHLYHMTGERIY